MTATTCLPNSSKFEAGKFIKFTTDQNYPNDQKAIFGKHEIFLIAQHYSNVYGEDLYVIINIVGQNFLYNHTEQTFALKPITSYYRVTLISDPVNTSFKEEIEVMKKAATSYLESVGEPLGLFQPQSI